MITKNLGNQKFVEVNYDGGTIPLFRSILLKSKKGCFLKETMNAFCQC